jgi:hypothetical protein
LADAVVVGSAIVRRIGEFGQDEHISQRINEFVEPLVKLEQSNPVAGSDRESLESRQHGATGTGRRAPTWTSFPVFVFLDSQVIHPDQLAVSGNLLFRRRNFLDIDLNLIDRYITPS